MTLAVLSTIYISVHINLTYTNDANFRLYIGLLRMVLDIKLTIIFLKFINISGFENLDLPIYS